MRVAVLADVHGNLPALDAVLAEVTRDDVDAVVLNGDFAAGPLPVETLDRLEALEDRAVWVRGNADREMVEVAAGAPVPPDHPAADLLGWSAAVLPRRHRERLADLPLGVVLDLDGLGPTRFCHATARSDSEIVLVDSTVDRFARCFAGVEEATVVLGHTHMPFDRLAGRRYVNAGSVGMPYGHRGAAWAVLGPHVELRRTPYDAGAAAAVLAGSAWPGAAGWADVYVRNPPSDLEALAAFTPAAGP